MQATKFILLPAHIAKTQKLSAISINNIPAGYEKSNIWVNYLVGQLHCGPPNQN